MKNNAPPFVLSSSLMHADAPSNGSGAEELRPHGNLAAYSALLMDSTQGKCSSIAEYEEFFGHIGFREFHFFTTVADRGDLNAKKPEQSWRRLTAEMMVTRPRFFRPAAQLSSKLRLIMRVALATNWWFMRLDNSISLRALANQHERKRKMIEFNSPQVVTQVSAPNCLPAHTACVSAYASSVIRGGI